jgi:hypothetical protein
MLRVFVPLLVAAVALVSPAAAAAEWHLKVIDAPAHVFAVDTVGNEVRVNAGGLWYAVTRNNNGIALRFLDNPATPKTPEGAVPDSRLATGSHDIARAWLTEPTNRYEHGVLGDKVEAGSLVIETRDGKQHTVKLKNDAVFEDLTPRIADIDGDGHDDVVLVKSYLQRGSALAVIADRHGTYQIVGETPPLGAANQWLNPAGIADFTGDGKPEIALVRQPHVVGALELWGWQDNKLKKIAEMAGFSNHIAGTRAIAMSAVGDFDGDHVADLALPSLDRSHLRVVAFAAQPRELANIALPAKAATDFGLITADGQPPLVVLGLADGRLAVAGQW